MVPFNQIALPIETGKAYVTTMTFEFLLDIVTIPEDVIEDNKGLRNVSKQTKTWPESRPL